MMDTLLLRHALCDLRPLMSFQRSLENIPWETQLPPLERLPQAKRHFFRKLKHEECCASPEQMKDAQQKKCKGRSSMGKYGILAAFAAAVTAFGRRRQKVR